MEREKLLKYTGMGPVGGDCCGEVYYQLTRPCTVKELCDYIVANDREWGYIGLERKRGPDGYFHGSLFGEPNIEYFHGKYVDSRRNPIEFNFPEEIANKTVKAVRASGGWSRMDYILEV